MTPPVLPRISSACNRLFPILKTRAQQLAGTLSAGNSRWWRWPAH